MKIPHDQWRSHWGCKGGGQSATPDSEKIAKNQEKELENQEKSGKKRRNREEKTKIGKVFSFFSFCPSWQIRLVTLLPMIFSNYSLLWKHLAGHCPLCRYHITELWGQNRVTQLPLMSMPRPLKGLWNFCPNLSGNWYMNELFFVGKLLYLHDYLQ